MLKCPAVPNIFSDRKIGFYRRRVFRKCRPETVWLNMKKESQKSYFERIEIYNSPVVFSEIEFISPKKQTRVLPNILRTSTSKAQLEAKISLPLSQTHEINGESAMPEHFQGITEVDRAGSRKRKQDYRQTNIRHDPFWNLGVKRKARSSDSREEKGRKMARLSVDKKETKETLKSKAGVPCENTEVFHNKTSLAIAEGEMSVRNMYNLTDQFLYPNEYTVSHEKGEMLSDELIDFSSNDIFSKCYYDSYSKQSLESSLELNERLDDIQSILNWSFNRDSFVSQCDLSRTTANEQLVESLNYVPKLGDSFLSKYELSAEELDWMTEWLSGKEIELDVIFENNHIRERFSERSAEKYNYNSDLEDHLLKNYTGGTAAQTLNINSNETNVPPAELIEDGFDFPDIPLSDEEEEKILENVDLAETLMKEIDEIDTTDLFNSGMIDSDETLSSEELTEIMLSALMEEAYPNSTNNVNNKTSKEAEAFSNITHESNEKKEEAKFSNNNNSDIYDKEMKGTEVCSNIGNDIGDKKLEWTTGSSDDDSTDSSQTPKSPFTSDNDSNSSMNETEQKNDCPAATLRKKRRKKLKKTKFVCSICPNPLRFRHQRTLALHMAAAHKGLYDIVCETCGRRFNKRYTYNRHIVNCRCLTERFQCDDCGRAYRHRSSLVAHRKSKHTKHKPAETKKYVCDVCSKSFMSVGWYNNHVKRHKNDG